MCELGCCLPGKAQLEDELRQKEKCMLHLRQVFTAAKTAEFCEVLSAILGVKVAFYDNRQVRVALQYDLSAVFVFQPAPWDPATKDGCGGSSSNWGAARMQLVEQGGGPQELPQLMRNWVEIEQSIPCFLVSVTLDCYDKWKRERDLGKVVAWGAGEGALGSPACIYCVAHNTTHNMLLCTNQLNLD